MTLNLGDVAGQVVHRNEVNMVDRKESALFLQLPFDTDFEQILIV